MVTSHGNTIKIKRFKKSKNSELNSNLKSPNVSWDTSSVPVVIVRIRGPMGYY